MAGDEEQTKTISVSLSTWQTLQQMKLDRAAQSIEDVIIELLANNHD